jgi:transposase
MMLPDTVQVADPFHVVQLANRALDECRRRVRTETLGHRGRKNDPSWRARRRLLMARQRLTDDQHDRQMGLLATGDPQREVWFAWSACEVVPQIYDHSDHELAVEWVAEIGRDFTDPEMPFEVRRLGRTITHWADQNVAWHLSHVRNAASEAVNNLAKRIKGSTR